MNCRCWIPALGIAIVATAGAAEPISQRNSFRIGGGDSVLCLAQTMASDSALVDMFDRGYTLVCRDAAVPIGLIHVLRMRGGDPDARLVRLRSERAICQPPRPQELERIGRVEVADCTLAGNAEVAYRVYRLRRGDLYYSAEGLAGYDSALRIGLMNVVADRPVAGAVDIALTGAGDPGAFARVQAGTLDRSRALAEAYRRNNSGSYAESAEFFAAVTRGELGRPAQAEALVNEALQKSNLGHFVEADGLLDRARKLLGNDPLVARQLRNYRAMHLLNQGLAELAAAELDRPLPEAALLPAPAIRRLVIDESTAARLNADSAATQQLGSNAVALQLDEKVQILEAQADLLRGVAARLTGEPAQARTLLAKADTDLAKVRGGQLPAIIWMRAQILGELGAIAEDSRQSGEAENYYRASAQAIEVEYPGSAVLQGAMGRLAGFYARSGRVEQALPIFREIVASARGTVNAPPSLARLLAPYAALLLERGDRNAMEELFGAAQMMIRPGVAQTQAILARELNGGSDEAARLFRQSVTLTRQVERWKSELNRIELSESATAGQLSRKAELQRLLAEDQSDQVATQARLAVFPRYRAVTSATLSLDELQQLLRPGEAYYKLTVIDELAFGLFVTPGSARAFRVGLNANELDDIVNRLRRTISTVSFGETVTYPFDAELAHRLYRDLFGPIESELAAVRNLVFEPDGAMLRLPPNLLVRSARGLESYRARLADPKADPFDMRGIAWLGRDLAISTAVSATAFRDVRKAPAATASRAYLGLGQHAVPGANRQTPGAEDCTVPIAAWSRPIAPDELKLAMSRLAGDDPSLGQIVTGSAFNDSALIGRKDLDDYRVLHFATHAVITAPSPGCAAQPALMTSFGDGDSDGLLTFREIFDLKLDADLVLLSACDTAAAAGAAATAEAGLGSGGDLALDGLVRAFVGAGGRLIMASHWPVPDDYDATGRLVGGLFSAPPGASAVDALRVAQRQLMDEAATSHPYYWSAFAVIGDGLAPVRPAVTGRVASAD
jgi:CHAT domain-containing protein